MVSKRGENVVLKYVKLLLISTLNRCMQFIQKILCYYVSHCSYIFAASRFSYYIQVHSVYYIQRQPWLGYCISDYIVCLKFSQALKS